VLTNFPKKLEDEKYTLKFPKNRKFRDICGQLFQKIENFEKRSDQFIRKFKISENELASFPNN